MADLVPESLPVLRHLRGVAAAQRWLADLPSLVGEVREVFDVRLSAPLHGGSCSWVAPAELPDGTRVIVKIGWPHREMYAEPAALRRWNGVGAVRLLAHDPHRHALLLQRCEPGRQLAADTAPAQERLRIGSAVLRQLWAAEVTPPDGIESLGPVCAQWADLVEERMTRLAPGYDPGLVRAGARLLRELPASAKATVLLHGDFNPGNILADSPTWLAIDPKPMIGDPAFDPWPLLEQIDDPFTRPDAGDVLRDRTMLLADALSLDAGRIALWSVARRVEAALWAAEHGDPAGGAAHMRQARMVADGT